MTQEQFEEHVLRIQLDGFTVQPGEEARTIFGFRAGAPYTDRWRWEFEEGRPKKSWKELDCDEPKKSWRERVHQPFSIIHQPYFPLLLAA
jgi:hypothetical protein